MTHVTGTIQTVSPTLTIGPDAGASNINFAAAPAPTGTKLLILHFSSANLPASNRLEVDLGYGTDVFTSADGPDFWTRPVNIYALPGGMVPIRYITNGASTGSVVLDKYGRGERHPGEQDPTALSNCDPFLGDALYVEPEYDPAWFCHRPPNWENVACVTPNGDVRARVAPSVGMIMHVHQGALSTCTVTLISPDVVLTAGHCMSDVLETADEAVKSSSVTFDYEVNCDGTRPIGYAATFLKVKRAIRHRWEGQGSFDYSLLQLEVPPGGLAINPVSMRSDLPAPGEQVFGIHHPNGAVKKLSAPHPGYDTVARSASNGISADFDVSGGSSGSGLFDTAGRITGVLSYGTACGLNYFPTAAILADIANPIAPQATRDVLLVMDRSGSMAMDAGNGRTKIEEAREAAALFVELVRSDSGNRIGLVSFSTSASSPPDFPIADVVAATKNALAGPPPRTGGAIGRLIPDGSTSIGAGLAAAQSEFPLAGANPRSILLLTDGLQNTPPMIADVEGTLSGLEIAAIGFGTEASLNGALLTQLAEEHGGLYTRAETGLALKKFFALAFGNIFESGALLDPDAELPEDQMATTQTSFQICGETSLTVIVGWDRSDATLLIEVTSPNGVLLTGASPAVDASTGRTWTFFRVKLPYSGEHDGTWQVRALRPAGGGEFPPPTPALHYFLSIIADGGPRLSRIRDRRSYYTGEQINPLVLFHDREGRFPAGARLRVSVARPDRSIGTVLSDAKLRPPTTIGSDTVPARHATLQALERESGHAIVGHDELEFELADDAKHTNTFETAGVFGNPLDGLLVVEGTYTFHVRATFGGACAATRELTWSIHVEIGIDPSTTETSIEISEKGPGSSQRGTLSIVPRDRYGNKLGPGKLDGIDLTGTSGTTITGPLRDNGDGSYTVPVDYDVGLQPELVVGQPGRTPIVIRHGKPKARNRHTCLSSAAVVLIVGLGVIVAIARHVHRRGS